MTSSMRGSGLRRFSGSRYTEALVLVDTDAQLDRVIVLRPSATTQCKICTLGRPSRCRKCTGSPFDSWVKRASPWKWTRLFTGYHWHT
jgi:hypothetical protein